MPITVVRTRGFKLGGDLDGDGQADPGDIFSHEIIVTNSDAVNRLNLVDTETENGLTIDPASVKIGPIAVNDAFNFSGNTPITFTAAQLLGNDLDPDDATPNLTITNVTRRSPTAPSSTTATAPTPSPRPPASTSARPRPSPTISSTRMASPAWTASKVSSR